ncbi:hypothetical protein HXX76_013879 [Chlamydomonas incerta]|uniref:PAS domain-containing protein n=1 Tax=Chlamydomonas incerta TaxID=51695 RepID=A0A835SKR2_CHLIN|nr:hypothetical protein HXX76_013879 [Chlamydomonas incerta]|eukprot:KAG2425298.1 hypothetical protein HXX76_013879 [Chlamydomonas incerta]
MFLDFLQLWLLVVNPSYGWDINADSKGWKVVSFIQLNSFLTSRGYTFFLVVFYIFVGMLAFNVALSIWVAYSFSNNRFEYVWPIQFLRWFGLIFYQVLDIATLTLLLVALDCNYFNVPSDIQFHNQEFPDISCFTMPHIIQVAVSVVSILMFVFLAISLVLSEMELNPLTRSYMAIPHTRVEGYGFAIKTIVTVASIMLSTSTKWLAVVYQVFFLLLFVLYVKWVPFVYSALNYVRCASYATVLYSTCLLTVMAFGGSSIPTSQQPSFRSNLTIALWAGMGPAALLGALACHLRLRHFQRVRDRFRDADPGVNSKSLFRFTDAREVEIVARCCRQWVDEVEGVLEPGAVNLCEALIKAGMVQLPQDPQMIILYSSFLIDVQGSYQSGYSQLQTAKKQSPGILERFAMFSREQEHTQKVSGANGGAGDSAVDLVAYVEFQRNHRLVARAHKEALLAMRAFWGLLLRSRVDFNHLSRALHRIEVSVKAAERAYRSVLARHAGSARLVRLYGRFLETVKFDPWAAAKWYSEADRLEDAAEHTKEALQLGGVEALLPGGGDRGLDLDGVAMICINAQGTIQVATPEAHALLGYGKNELKGKDVGAIMPPPFSDRHSAYVRKYVETGVGAIIERTSHFVALSKSRQVVPVRLTVTKVSGLNEDSVFMGVMEPIPLRPDEACCWVLSGGSIIAADDRFCDWLGYEQAELLATELPELLEEGQAREAAHKALSGVTRPTTGAALGTAIKSHRMRRASNVGEYDKSMHGTGAAGGASLSSGDVPVHLQRSTWRHKYSDVMPFDAVLEPGHYGSVKVHKVTLKRCTVVPPALQQRARGAGPIDPWEVGSANSATPDPQSAGPLYTDCLMVADHRGRILHVTRKLASELGRSVEALRAGGLEMLIPEPVSVLHAPWVTDLSRPYPTDTSLLGVPPPYSCRRGVPVCLAAYSPVEGTVLKPFRLQVKQRLAQGGSVRLHVLKLEPLSVEQATAQRRLRLTVDLRGSIVAADDATPKQLYGAAPAGLVGSSIASLVDCLDPDALEELLAEGGADVGVGGGIGGGMAAGGSLTGPNPFLKGASVTGMGAAAAAAAAAAGAGALGAQSKRASRLGISAAAAEGGAAGAAKARPGVAGGGDDGGDILEYATGMFAAHRERRITKALLELGRRASETPGCSWRVGVRVLPDETARRNLDQLAAVMGPDDVSVAAKLMGSQVVPAVMRLRLVRKPAPPPPVEDEYAAYNLASPQVERFAVNRSGLASRGGDEPGGGWVSFAGAGERQMKQGQSVRYSPSLGGPVAEALETRAESGDGGGDGDGDVLADAAALLQEQPGAPLRTAPSPQSSQSQLQQQAPAPPSASLGAASAALAASVAAANNARAQNPRPGSNRFTTGAGEPDGSQRAQSLRLPQPPPINTADDWQPQSQQPTPSGGAPAFSRGTSQAPFMEPAAVFSPGGGVARSRSVLARSSDTAEAPAAAAAVDSGGLAPDLQVEIELWRSDLLSGILEVDDRGRIVRADYNSPLTHAGMVLGMPSVALAGMPLASVLPMPPGGISEMLNNSGGPADAGAVRGALKKRVSAHAVRMSPPTAMTTRHAGDCCPVELRIQAVRQDGPGCSYLIVRPAAPTAAQPGFMQWLYDGDTSGLMPPRAVSIAGYTHTGGLARGASLRGMTSMPPGGPVSRKATANGLTQQDSVAGAAATAAAIAAGVASAAAAAVPPVPAHLAAALMAPPPALSGLSMSSMRAVPVARGAVGRGGAAQPDAAADVAGDGGKLPHQVITRDSSDKTDSAYGMADLAGAKPGSSGSGNNTAGVDGAAADDDLALAAGGAPSPRAAPQLGAVPEGAAAPQGGSKLRKQSSRNNLISSWVMSSGQSFAPGAPAGADGAGKQPVAFGGGPDDDEDDRSSKRGSGSGSGSGDCLSSDGKADAGDGADEGAAVKGGGGGGGGMKGGGGGGGPTGKKSAGSEMEDVESEAGATMANYHVGKRFKKLFRILSSPLAQQPARTLRSHTSVCVAILLAVHIATFVLLSTKITSQKAAVKDLASVTTACRRVHELAINGRILDALYSNHSYSEGIPAFGDPLDEALGGVYEDNQRLMIELKDLHHGVYLGFRNLRRISNKFGLRDIWDQPLLNISIFYDPEDGQPADTAPPTGHTLMGLWDAGNLYLSKTLDMSSNGQAYVDGGRNFSTWSTWQFIQANGPSVINAAYAATLDGLVQLTVQQSTNIYMLQLIILCLEGGLLCAAVCVYVWIVASRFSQKRHKLYNVFLSIPMGVTRGLANMSLTLEPGKEEEEDDLGVGLPGDGTLAADHGAGTAADGGAEGGGDGGGLLSDGALKAAAASARRGVRMDPAVRGNSYTTPGVGGGAAAGAVPQRSTSMGGWAAWGSKKGGWGTDAEAADGGDGHGGGAKPANLTSLLSFWRGRAKVSPASTKTKRTLSQSRRLAYTLVGWFAAWGLVIIIVNLIGYYSLQSLTAPIATLNVVNMVLIRFHRIIFYILETAASLTIDTRLFWKDTLRVEQRLWEQEYAAMLYGNEAVPNSDNPHFKLAKTGVVFGGYKAPADLLYHTGVCFAEFLDDCQPEGSIYYQATHNGLDVLLKNQFAQVNSFLAQPPEVADLNSTEFRFFWSTGQSDTEGGLNTMSELFHDEVQASYAKVQQQQIAMFVIGWIWALLFLLLQLRPLIMRAGREMRRIAELLSQLPPEIDCEGLVNAAIVGAANGGQGAAGGGGGGGGANHTTTSLFGAGALGGVGGTDVLDKKTMSMVGASKSGRFGAPPPAAARG